MNKDAQYFIKTLHLEKHPEGGYYREIYRFSDGRYHHQAPAF